MSGILLDLSGKINPSHVEVLSIIRDIAASLRIPFFIVGASARDYILDHVYNRPAVRMTMDVDIGVKVESWEQYEKIVNALLKTGKFTQDKRNHRFLYGDVKVDIVPFGSLADKEKNIHWPPDQTTIMSVLGFQEAYEHSITIILRTEPLLEIRIPTLAGLALIKLISWADAYPRRQRDAEDLEFIMHHYEEAGNLERLFEIEPALMEEENFDARIAGIRLLGRDMAVIADPETRTVISSILNRETGEQRQYRLVTDMTRARSTMEGAFEEGLKLVEKLKRGFVEIAG